MIIFAYLKKNVYKNEIVDVYPTIQENCVVSIINSYRSH